MSTALSVLIQNVAKELGYASGTSTSGSTTTLLDSSTDSPFDTADDEQLFENAWVKIESDADTTNTGAVRRIKTYTPSSQTITVSSAFPLAVDDDDQYGIYQGLPPARMGTHRGITEYINDVLRALHHREYTPLTLVADGDMETSGTTSWTASNATLAKTTTAANVRLGKQSLTVTNTLALGYARNASTYPLYVTAGQQYTVLAQVQATSGTARLELYDVTNAASIDTADSAQIAPRWLYFTATIPTSCTQVYIRLTGVEATAVTVWDNVMLRNMNAHRFDLPSWLTAPGAIEEVEAWRGGTTGPDDDRAIDELRSRAVTHWRVLHDPLGQTPWRLEIPELLAADELLVLRAFRPWAELSADTDTTDCNADLVKAGALTRIYVDIGDNAKAGYWTARYAGLLATHRPRMTKRTGVGVY